MLAMIYKLGMSAKKRWHRIWGFHYLAKVIKGVKFRDGVEVSSNTDNNRSAVPKNGGLNADIIVNFRHLNKR